MRDRVKGLLVIYALCLMWGLYGFFIGWQVFGR